MECVLQGVKKCNIPTSRLRVLRTKNANGRKSSTYSQMVWHCVVIEELDNNAEEWACLAALDWENHTGELREDTNALPTVPSCFLSEDLLAFQNEIISSGTPSGSAGTGDRRESRPGRLLRDESRRLVYFWHSSIVQCGVG